MSYYANLAEVSKFGLAQIDAYFDNGTIDTATDSLTGYPQTQCSPQVRYSGAPVVDTGGWTKVEGSFIASGNERFITIGNFNSNASTTLANAPPSYRTATQPSMAYYLIEDVSVIESDLPAYAGADTHVGAGDSVYIGRPREIGLENTWTVLGSAAVIGKGAGIWVRPATTTSYVVTQTLCGNTTTDTVRVDVWAAGVTSINGGSQRYSLSPNPGSGVVNLQQLVPDARPVSIRIVNNLGQELQGSRTVLGQWGR